MTTTGSPLRRVAAAAFALLLLGSAAACSSSDSAGKASTSSGTTTSAGPDSAQLNTDVNGGDDTNVIASGADVVTFQPTTKATGSELDDTVSALKDRVRALGLEDVKVQVKGDSIEASVPKGVAKADVESLGDAHDLQFRAELQSFPGGANDDTTDPKCDAAEATATAPCLATDQADANNVLQLGPADLDGTIVDTATAAQVEGDASQWQVTVTAKEDKKAGLNTVLDHCFAGDETCPGAVSPDQTHGQLAVVLDGTVLTLALVSAQGLADTGLVLTGGYSKDAAEKLAKELRLSSAPLPLVLKVA